MAGGPRLFDRLMAMDRPDARAAGVQTWNDLLSLHWPIPIDALKPLVPESLVIDRFEGVAYVSIIAFRATDTRPSFLPRSLGGSFNEVNVRTYVHRDGEDPGIYLFAADTDSRLATLGMRLGEGLRSYTARIQHEHDTGRLTYVWERPTGATFRAVCQLGGRVGAAEPGTLEHFLNERYFVHADRSASLWTTQIHHAPIDFERARVLELRDDVLHELGLPEREGHPVVTYARRVETEVFLPRIHMAA